MGTADIRVFYGTRGDDRIPGPNTGFFAESFVQAFAGNDQILFDGGQDTIHGGRGDDFIVTGLGDDVIYGDEDNDIAWGGFDDDIIFGGHGDDALLGGEGSDRLRGGAGDDRLDGGNGDDRIFGDAGNDTILGQNGDDEIQVSAGNHSIYGGAGNDYIRATGDGQIVAYGGAGDDQIELVSQYGEDLPSYLPGIVDGGDGNDEVSGGRGDDVLRGAAGDDMINASTGDDRVVGGSGDDRLNGSVGDDLVLGGIGNDLLQGGSGEDLLTGGSGSDLFSVAFRAPDGLQGVPDGDVREADDVVRDFVQGQDKLQISFYEERGEQPSATLIASFADLDTNSDGLLNEDDAGFDLQSITLDGQVAASLVLDVALLAFDHPVSDVQGTIALYGVTTLGVLDIDATPPQIFVT